MAIKNTFSHNRAIQPPRLPRSGMAGWTRRHLATLCLSMALLLMGPAVRLVLTDTVSEGIDMAISTLVTGVSEDIVSVADLEVAVTDLPQEPSGSRVSGQGGSAMAAAAAVMNTTSQLSEPPALYLGMLELQNQFRAMHGSPPLVWDLDLAQAAANAAQACDFRHAIGGTGGAGENMFATNIMTAEPEAYLATGVGQWYREVQLYNWNDPRFSPTTGHFTQLVWRGTKQVGCAMQTCPEGIATVDWEYGVVVICRYLEHGNWAGEFEANVLPVGSSIPRVEPSPAPAPPPSPSPSPLPSPPASAGKPPKLRVTVLMQGKGLNSGACLVSLPARRAQLCMQSNGNVVLKVGTKLLWSSKTSGSTGVLPYRLVLNSCGNLQVLDSARKTQWEQRITKKGVSPCRLVVSDSGGLVLLDAANSTLWQPRLTQRAPGP